MSRQYVYYSPKLNEIHVFDAYDHCFLLGFSQEWCDTFGLIYWEYIGSL